MFFGGSSYLGGNAGVFNNHTGLNGLALGGGLYNHPSFSLNRGINYFAGTGAQNTNALPNDQYMPAMATSIQGLQMCLNAARDEQGVLGRFWDGIKNVTGIGLGSNKCQQYIDKAATGQMSVQDAYSKICKYTTKQRGGVNIISGLAAGALSVAAVSTAPLTGGMSILAAAGIGAAAKAGLKTVDRATNEIENDALDAKKIIKDGLSGALNGVSTKLVMARQAGQVITAQSAKEALKQGAIQGAKCGAISGAAISGGDYLLECGFEQDQKFSADDFITTTIYGGATGGLIGGITGGISAKAAYNKCFGPQSWQGGQDYYYYGPNPNNPNGPQPAGGKGGYYQYQGLGGSTAQPNPASQHTSTSSAIPLGTSTQVNNPTGAASVSGASTGNIQPQGSQPLAITQGTGSVIPLPASSNPINNLNSPDVIRMLNPYTSHSGSKGSIQLPLGVKPQQLAAPADTLSLPGTAEVLGLPGPTNGLQTPAVVETGSSSAILGQNTQALLGLPAPKTGAKGAQTPSVIYLPESSSATLNQLQPNGTRLNIIQNEAIRPQGQGTLALPEKPLVIEQPVGEQPAIQSDIQPAAQPDIQPAGQPNIKQPKTQHKPKTQSKDGNPDNFIKNLTSFLKDKLKH